MPEISRFFGIIIAWITTIIRRPIFMCVMVNKKPSLRFSPSQFWKDNLAPRVLGLVIEWASAHQAELLQNWELARQQESLISIQPLE